MATKGGAKKILFPDLLEDRRAAIAAALPRHVDLDRMIRSALTAFRMSVSIQKCDPTTVLASVIQAAQLGLEIGVNGESYLTAFYSSRRKRYECQMIPGYRGLIKLAMNTGQISSISSRIVYEHDEFDILYGTEDKVIHRPKLRGDRGSPYLAYCIAKFTNGGAAIEHMEWDEILEIKAGSKSRDKEGNLIGPWVDWEMEMARKTVARRGSKYWPMSVELSTAIALDTAAAAGISQQIDIEAAMRGDPFVVPKDDGGDQEEEDEVKRPQSRSGQKATTMGRGNG